MNPQHPERKEFECFLAEQWLWSLLTFGAEVKNAGIIAHIRKELIEVEASPADLEEWVDVILLALDGFWRNGGKASEVLPMLRAKLEINRKRTWPATSGDEPAEHLRD